MPLSTFRMPDFYRPPWGGPMRWQDEVSGELPAAVTAFFDHGLRGRPMTAAQIELVRQYVEYYLNAPCWRTEHMEAEFAKLRADVREARTPELLAAVLSEALGVGLDPF